MIEINQSTKNIIVVGDIMLDEYLVGDHERNSPEADVPVILFTKKDVRLGGAGNVALNMKQLDLNPILLSTIAEDDAGHSLKKLCKEADIQTSFIATVDRPTTIKQRIVDSNYKQYLRVDTETTEPLSISEETALVVAIKNTITSHSIDGILIQDYNKGTITPYVIKNIQDLCKQSEIPIFVDPKHDHFRLLSDCTVFKPNLKELSHIIDKPLGADAEEVVSALNQLAFPSKLIFITLAEKGIIAYDTQEGKSYHIRGIHVPDADVSGAGDTVLAVLVWAYFHDYSIQKMAEIANKAGSKVCRKSGVSVVSIADLGL